MSTGGKNDVEFTLGVNNSKFDQDLDAAADTVHGFADDTTGEIDQIGIALDSLAEHVDSRVKGIGRIGEAFANAAVLAKDAAAAAKGVYDWVVSSEKATSGLNAALDREKTLIDQINKGNAERRKKLLEGDDQEGLAAALAVEEKNAAGLEDQIGTLNAKVREFQRRIDKIKAGGDNGSIFQQLLGSSLVAGVGTGRLEEMYEELALLRREAWLSKEAIEDLKDATSDEAKVGRRTDEEQALRLRRLGKIGEMNKKNADQQAKTDKEEADRVDSNLKKRERLLEKRAKEREKEEKNQLRFQEQLADVEEARRRANRPIGGFDKGLDAISDRIAGAASTGNAALERLNAKQLEIQTKMAASLKASEMALKKIKPGMKQ